MVVFSADQQNLSSRLNLAEWLLILGGNAVVLLSWTLDYFDFGQRYPVISVEKSLLFFSTYTPQDYRWWMFGLGEALMLLGIYVFFYRTHRRHKTNFV